MKTKVLFSLFAGILLSFAVQAQKTVQNTETMPQYKSGTHALYQFINENLNYPKDALAKGIRGTVLVRLTIDPNGNIRSSKIDHSVHPDLDKEAMRLVSLMGKSWKPGTLNGKPVVSDYSMSVTFIPAYTKDPAGKPVYGTDDYNFSKGMACSKNKDYLNALFYFSDALDSNASDINILFYRCLCKIRLGDKLGACDDYKRIKTLQNPDKPEMILKYCAN
ncbi:MAG TPA: energy transducer TonB [Bacteroidia bacterium]|nr:energy transducer TonB [Bacteroidia bacterium]